MTISDEIGVNIISLFNINYDRLELNKSIYDSFLVKETKELIKKASKEERYEVYWNILLESNHLKESFEYAFGSNMKCPRGELLMKLANELGLRKETI